MQVEKTITITMDEKSHDVSSLSPEVQQMVAYLDDWRQREVNLTSDLLMVRGALRDLQNALADQLRKDFAPTAANEAVVEEAVEEAVVKPAKKTAKKK